MNDFVTSLIRTYVPVGVGAVLTWLAVHYNVVVPQDASAALVLGVGGLLTALYYAVARAVEKAYPWIGKLLVGLGAGSSPAYQKPTPESAKLLGAK